MRCVVSIRWFLTPERSVAVQLTVWSPSTEVAMEPDDDVGVDDALARITALPSTEHARSTPDSSDASMFTCAAAVLYHSWIPSGAWAYVIDGGTMSVA